MPYASDTIRSLSDAVGKLKWLEKHFFAESEWTPHKFPFGLWFRGHSMPAPDLQPRVFRNYLPPPFVKRQGCWDETNVYEHLKLLAPAYCTGSA